MMAARLLGDLCTFLVRFLMGDPDILWLRLGEEAQPNAEVEVEVEGGAAKEDSAELAGKKLKAERCTARLTVVCTAIH